MDHWSRWPFGQRAGATRLALVAGCGGLPVPAPGRQPPRGPGRSTPGVSCNAGRERSTLAIKIGRLEARSQPSGMLDPRCGRNSRHDSYACHARRGPWTSYAR